MLFCISLSEKLLTKVYAINIPCSKRQYINTSHISFIYGMYFFFQTVVLNIDSVNLIICCLYENEKHDMLYNLKLHYLVADIFHWM